MSKILDETNNVTSGFFNGTKNEDGTIDRAYDANDISSMFDGLITDGIFGTIGDQFACSKGTESNELVVYVGTGKAWFDKTWISNNAVQKIVLDAADSTKDRIDAIVIDIDKRNETRKNTIQYIVGEPALNPKKPTLVKKTSDEGSLHNQYLLRYIRVKHEKTNSKDLEFLDDREVNFITGPASTIDSKTLLAEWNKNFDNLYAEQQKDLEDVLKSVVKNSEATVEAEITTWKNGQQAAFQAWFDSLNATLDTNVATNLAMKLKREKINRLLQNGFEQCTKTISEDGKTITSYNSAEVTVDPDSDMYYKIEKAFNDDFSESTTTLRDKKDVEIAKMTKEVDPTDPTGNSFITNIVYKQV